MDVTTKQKETTEIRKNTGDNYKRYMLKFYHENFGNETFFFETKEDMLKFASQDGIKIESMFYFEVK